MAACFKLLVPKYLYINRMREGVEKLSQMHALRDPVCDWIIYYHEHVKITVGSSAAMRARPVENDLS
jgi:hypothetical protein